jgi:nitrogen regulatory protein P-II 1
MLRESHGAMGFGSRDERLAGNRQVEMEEDDPKSAFSRPNEKGAVVQSGRVVQIIALVKPFRAQAVLAALESVEVLGGTVREAMGYGRQKNRLHQYLGSEYNSSFVPKVELTVFVEQEHAQAAIKAIVGQARTGRIGDGKILVIHCLEEFLSW